jgi:hypothetical protein
MKTDMLEIADQLVQAHLESEPSIREVYLFPCEDEVRLIEVDPSALPSDEQIVAFHFGPSVKEGISVWTAIAVIPPEDKEKLPPPSGWGQWKDAIKLWPKD